MLKQLSAAFCLLLSIIACAENSSTTVSTDSAAQSATEQPRIVFETSLGNFTIALRPDKAPLTVANFLQYVDSGHYTDTIFHRVIDGFMVQGGGFTANMQQKATQPPVRNEADNGLANVIGSVAMARTNYPDSATSQFFINIANNVHLNHYEKTPRGWGYTVFGQVVDGMETVEKIKAVQVGNRGFFQNVPTQAIVINSARRVEATSVTEQAPAANKTPAADSAPAASSAPSAAKAPAA